MFRRRNKPSLTTRLRNMIWPEGGWKRYGQYILMRLNRLKGTPQEIAAGVACGVAISFTPFVGFHFVLAAITAWLVRGNILASALGTAAGNPPVSGIPAPSGQPHSRSFPLHTEYHALFH